MMINTRIPKRISFPFILCAALIFIAAGPTIQKEKRIMVFTKTAGFIHSSIPAGTRALLNSGKEIGFHVDTTDDATKFTTDNLEQYDAIVFLNTTGDVLNATQQKALQNFIRQGGGFAGIHAAADTEYDWPWYGKLVGGYFKSHPHIQDATVRVTNQEHISTNHLPAIWERKDEWYNYKNLNPEVTVLATLDENSYEGGKNGEHHPIAWYHEYDGGRAFYTGGGHTDESYSDPLFLKHMVNGILWAAGKNPDNH